MSGLGDVEPTMDLLGIIVDHYIEHTTTIHRIYPVLDVEKCRCPDCGAPAIVRFIEHTEATEPDVAVRMEPSTMTCTKCGVVTRVR